MKKTEAKQKIAGVAESAKEPESFPLPLWRERGRTGVVWAVAGFDPSSGAGITADLMTFAAHGLFGCSAITALTVQSTLGVFGCEAVAPEMVRDTLERLWEDVPPLGIKLGMLGSAEIVGVVSDFLKQAGAVEGRPLVVFDPVLRSSSGRDLYPHEALEVVHERLLPVVDWVTPNWAELSLLSAAAVEGYAGAERAARVLGERHPGLRVVATGGDQVAPTDLVVLPGGEVVELRGERVKTSATHGTGCAFSSALLAGLVAGMGPVEAVRGAKRFVEGALRAAPGIGRGRGPMGLLWRLQGRE